MRVVPILVEGAVMPRRQDLPESLAGLARRQALLIRHESFRYDAGRLLTAIERILAAPAVTAVPSAPDAHGVRSAGNAVGEVARKDSEPAATDPGRAARLLTDAERLANSLTGDNEKAPALSSVAEALAAIDPDRAERIANSLTRKYKDVKASALSRVAKALVATDPGRARAFSPTPNASPTPSPASTRRHRR